jgi:hypothetical protein
MKMVCLQTAQSQFKATQSKVWTACALVLLMVFFAVDSAEAATTLVAIPGYGMSSPVVGSTTSSYTGDGGLATAATIETPWKTIFDSAGNMYIADKGANVVRMINASTGLISTVVGGATKATVAGTTCPSGTGTYTDTIGNGCAATGAILSGLQGIAIDPTTGNLYVVDSSHYEIRKITGDPTTGNSTISIYAGIGTEGCPAGGGVTAVTITSSVAIDPQDIAFDSFGNAYVPMNNTHCREVMKIPAGGATISLFEGQFASGTTPVTGGPTGYVSGTTAAASNTAASYFISLTYVAVDKNNIVYLGGGAYNSIIKITPTGPNGGNVITTVAGLLNGTAVADSGDGGLATAASLNVIGGMTVDSYGNVFITESTGNRVREVMAGTGKIYTIAGGGASLLNTGSALSTSLNTPNGITVDSSGNFYLSDGGNHEVRKLSPVGFGNTPVGSSATGGAYAIMAETSTLSSIALKTDAATPEFTLGTVTGCTADGKTSNALGVACTIPVTFKPTHAGLRNEPIVITDASGNIYQIPLVGIGTAPVPGLLPGTISSVASTVGVLKTPTGPISANADGAVFIADTGNNVVRKVFPAGVISVFAGTAGTSGYTGDGAAATAATLNGPSAVATDVFGNVYIADTGNNVVRVVNAAGNISTFAGTGTAGFSGNGGVATSALLNGPAGLAVDLAGNVYISDTNNDEVREVTLAKGNLISLIAGNGSAGYAGDGGLATASALNDPLGLVVDSSYNVYIADSNNDVVRKITASTGLISTIAGMPNTGGYSGDVGLATSAELSAPSALTLDAASNLYIADAGNDVIRQVSASGQTITTIVGTAGVASYLGDGGAATAATLNEPGGIAIDGSDNLYILDAQNSVVREVSLTTTPAIAFADTVVSTTNSTPVTKTLQNLGNLSLSITGVNVSAQFTQQSTTANGVLNCGTTASSTVAASLASGAGCATVVAFAPTLLQSNTGSLTLTDNAGNTTGSTQLIAVSGKGVSALDTVTVNVPTVSYPAASQATITVTSSGVAGTGTVTYSIDGTSTPQTATLVSGTVTVNLGSLPSGAHVINVNYPGNSTYGDTTASAAFLVQGYTVSMSVVLNPTTPTYGSPVSATVTLASTAGTPPVGTVSYRLDNSLTRGATETSDTATFSLGTLAVGKHTMVVTYMGNTQDEAVIQTVTIVVNPAPTTIILMPSWPSTDLTPTSSPSTPYTGQTITFTATVSDLLGIIPAGTIQFMDGTTLLCTNTLASGSTSITISALTTSSPTTCPALLVAGTHALTAVYTGSTNFAVSTSAVLNQGIAAADFTLLTETTPTPTSPASTPITSVSLAAGQSVPLDLYIQGNNDAPTSTTTYNATYAYAGTITFSCTGMPVFMGCSFSPTSVTITNTANSANTYCYQANTCNAVGTSSYAWPNTAMSINTLGSYQNARLNHSNSIIVAGFLLPGVLLAGLLGIRRKRLSPVLTRRLTLLLALLVLSGISGLSGCGYTISGAPLGSYQINVVGTDSANNIVESTPLTVIVTQ